MKDYKSFNILLCVSWTIIFVAIILILLFPKHQKLEEPSTNLTTTQKTSSVMPTIIKQELDTEINITEEDNKNIEQVEGNWYYLDIDDSRYSFCFSKDKSRVDLRYYADNTKEEYVTGYSVYSIEGNQIIMKYLPNAFPQKSFTLTIKDNKIYYKNELLKN